MRLPSFICACFALLLVAAPARAVELEGNRITRPMTAVDTITLQGEGVRVTLWGIRSAQESAIQAEALDFMDRLIGNGPVSCKAVSGAGAEIVARCSVQTGEDLGLELLSHGYAMTDRRQAISTVPAYIEAHKAARQAGVGLWRATTADNGRHAAALPPLGQLLLNVVPIAGLLLLAFVVHFRMKRLETLQIEGQEHVERKESQLLARERHVLASTLEGELTENKNRIEAFLTIYGAMLEDLKSTTETPKYQQSGDIVQKHPLLSKTVFEGNVGKFSLLDMKLAAQLSKLYSSFPKEQEYINIPSTEPLGSVVALVEKVLREAEAMVGPITAAIQALDEIMAVNRRFEG